jgi:hypothetical protein
LKKIIILLFLNVAYGAYTIQPDPNCVIKGKIEYIFLTKKEIDRPIYCAVNEKPELTFCEGDEVKSPKGKNKMTVLTLIPKEDRVFLLAPNYGYQNQEIKLETVESVQNYDCLKRLEALKSNIKWVVINEAQFHEKPKEPIPTPAPETTK